MSREPPESDDNDVRRRTFMKASGAVAGAGLLGAGAVGGAAADAEFDERFRNWRTVEARKVWDRGYRGRPDRALALTDSPADARHAELGPWNGAILEQADDGLAVRQIEDVKEIETFERLRADEVGSASFTGGDVGVPGLIIEETTGYFAVVSDEEDIESFGEPVSFERNQPRAGAGGVGLRYPPHDFTVPAEAPDADEYWVRARVRPGPQTGDGVPEQAGVSLAILDENGERVINETASASLVPDENDDEVRVSAPVDPGGSYQVRVTTWRAVTDGYELDLEFEAFTRNDPEGVVGYEVEGEFTPDAGSPAGASGTGTVGVEDVGGSTENSASFDGLDGPATVTAEVAPGLYRFRVETGDASVSDWRIDAAGYTLIEGDESVTREELVFGEFEGDPVPDVAPGEVTPETPKLIGFYNEAERYTGSPAPTVDPRGHGSHVAGIMTGTGRASEVDFTNTNVDRAQTVVLPTEFIEYTVEAGADETVFASAFGEGVTIEIVGPGGEVIRDGPLRGDSIIVDVPAPHDNGTVDYTVRVRPYETDAATDEAAESAQEGTPAAARLKRIAYGTYRTPADAIGERVDSDTSSIHSGMAPNFSLVSLEGLPGPTEDLRFISGDLADELNVRAVNMSWGIVYGIPLGVAGFFGANVFDGIKEAADSGILSVAAAGNAFTPANGNAYPAVAGEVISVVATGPFDGITSYSAGGIGGRDSEDGSINRKPDVTAPGGDIKPDIGAFAVGYPVPSRVELSRSARSPGSEFDSDPDLRSDPVRDHVSVGGTSMASPYTCGTAGLVAEAMEFTTDGESRRPDDPDAVTLPEPADTGFDDVMRLKQVVLATANETAFTAAPYHTAKNVPSAPTYTGGGRDPYEGYGRVNPDAAVDAVSRNLLGTDVSLGDDTVERTYEEAVGTYVPEDSRAVAGYVDVPGGDLEVSVDFTGYTGGNRGLAKGAPHLDLFVYDAANPAENGEPNIVASDQGVQGSASVSVGVDRGSEDDPNRDTYYVVAKIVNIPGVVNGYDVQASFDMGVNFDPADEFPPDVVDLNVSGSRDDDASVFTAGQTNTVEITVEDFNEELADAVTVTDQVPDGWTVNENFGDVEKVENDDGSTTVDLGTVSTGDLGSEAATRQYFVEAPDDGADDTGTYTFGPAEAEAVRPKSFENDPDREQGSTSEEFGGTDTDTVVGASTDV